MPLTAVEMGRFISNLKHPHQGYLDPLPIEARRSHEGSFTMTSTSQAIRETGFITTLTSALSNVFRRKSGHRLTFEPSSAKSYTLDNSDDWFEKAVEKEDTRRWVEKCIEINSKMYLVVGFVTFSDTRILCTSHSAREVDIKLNLSANNLLATLGILTPTVDHTSSGSRVRVESREEDSMGAFIPGEKIFALQIRRVKQSWRHSRLQVESSKEWWYVEGTLRSAYSSEDDDDDDDDDNLNDGDDKIVRVDIEDPDPEIEGWSITHVDGVTIYEDI